MISLIVAQERKKKTVKRIFTELNIEYNFIFYFLVLSVIVKKKNVINLYANRANINCKFRELMCLEKTDKTETINTLSEISMSIFYKNDKKSANLKSSNVVSDINFEQYFQSKKKYVINVCYEQKIKSLR